MTAMAIDNISINGSSHDMIKEESLFAQHKVDIKQEPDENVSLCDELEKKLKVKCGEVFVLFGEQFILVCTFCDGNFNNMQLLGEHLFEKHAEEFFKKDEDEIEPKLSTTLTTELVKSNATKGGVCESTNANSKGTKLSNKQKAGPRNACGIDNHRINRMRYQQKIGYPNERSHNDKAKHQNLKKKSTISYRYKCQVCGVTYKNRRNLVRHARKISCVQSQTNKSKLVPREECEIGIWNTDEPDNANIKDQFHPNDNDSFVDVDVVISEQSDQDSRSDSLIPNHYSCKICSVSFNREEQLKCHLQIHSVGIPGNDNDPELFCEICERQFDTKKAFSNHQRRHRQFPQAKVQVSDRTTDSDSNIAKNPDLYCDLCQQFFRNKKDLYTHADSHDSIPSVLQGDNEFLKCKYCWKEFSKYSERKTHETTHTGPRPYECPYCHKGFVSNLSRKSHFRVHTGESPHQCDQCLKVFRDKYDLRRHIQRHLNIRDVACELCEKRFYHKYQLELHMRTHTKERPYVCEDCGKSFVVLPQLKDHQLRHTGIKNVKCEVCGRLFYSKSVLKVHMASHSDEKPFECNVCGRRFSRAKAMQKHMKLHSDVKKYVCNICGKAYAQDSGLYAHKKTHARQL